MKTDRTPNMQQALEGLGVVISDAALLRRMLDFLPKPHYHQLFCKRMTEIHESSEDISQVQMKAFIRVLVF